VAGSLTATASSATQAFAAACLAAALGPLDAMVNPAFPAITADFALDVAQIQWIPVAYLLAYGSLALVTGRIGDLYGYRRVCLAGLGVCVFAFAACAAAPTYAWLLVARVLQGVGIALVLGGAPPLALAAYPESRRTAVLARYASVLALVLALSPAAGGMLVETFGWRSVYAVRVPVSLAALLLLARVPAAPRHSHAHGFDGAGAALLTFWLTAFVLAMALPAAIGWLLALVAAAGLAMFILHEARSPAPIVRPALFLDPRFALFNTASLGVHFVGFAIFLLGPYFFVRVAGLSTLAGGVLLSFGPAGAALGSALAERLVRRHGTGRVAFASASLVAITVGAAAAWDSQSAVLGIGLLLFAQGAGIGLFQVAYTDYVVTALPVAERGVAASLPNLTRTLGVLAAASLLSALFRAMEAGAAAADASAQEAFLAGYRVSVACAGAALGLFLAATLARPRLWTARQDPARRP
jgi:MFS family permease